MFPAKVARRLAISLFFLLCLLFANIPQVFAISVDDYFSYSYEVHFSQNEIHDREIFYATVTGQATCENDLPLPISEAYISSRVIAEHQISGVRVILSSSYTLTLDSFPQETAEVTQSSVVVPLIFPEGSLSGTYSVIGELIEARVQAVFWFDVTSFLPSSEILGLVTYVSDDGGSIGGSSTGGADGTIAESEVILPCWVDADGRFIQDVNFSSEDSRCMVSINENTIGLTEFGEPLNEINIVKADEPPILSENISIIGLVYDFSPDAATFTPAITVAFTYDESLIPDGISEKNLVIATWDEEMGEWVSLDCVVDIFNNVITAQVSHFTLFTVAAYTRQAAFTINDLIVTPARVATGDEVVVSILLTNIGDLTGSCKVTVRVDDIGVTTKQITLAGGTSQRVNFVTRENTAGTHTINVDTLSGVFTVEEPSLPVILTSWISRGHWGVVGVVFAGFLVVVVVIFLLLKYREKLRQFLSL